MVRTKDEIQARIKEFKSAMKCGTHPIDIADAYFTGIITGLGWCLGDDNDPPPEP